MYFFHITGPHIVIQRTDGHVLDEESWIPLAISLLHVCTKTQETKADRLTHIANVSAPLTSMKHAQYLMRMV